MLFVTYVFMFGIIAAVEADLPQIFKNGCSKGKCTYSIILSENHGTKGGDKAVSSRLDIVDTRLDGHDVDIQRLQDQLKKQKFRIQKLEKKLQDKYRDCADHRLAGQTKSGVYTITPEHAQSPLSVWCDMETEKGGWTVFQKRQDGSVDFYRDWAAYKKGFGNIDGEYWLGNDNIYRLTNQKRYKLRVDLWDFDGNRYWAEYDDFSIENENSKYAMHVGSYKGTAKDAMTLHNGMMFTTRDRDNDRHGGGTNCATHFKGAFWYNACYRANLNGIYHSKKYEGGTSINWSPLFGKHTALKKTEMKIRPMTFDKK